MDENDYIYLLLAFILGYFANSIIKQMCGQNIEGLDGPVYCNPSPMVCENHDGRTPITCETDNDCLCNAEKNKNKRECLKAIRKRTKYDFGSCISAPPELCPGGSPCPDCGDDKCLCPSPPPSKEIVPGQPGCEPGQKCGDGSDCPPSRLCPVPCAGLKGNERGRISCNKGTTLKEGTFYNTSDPQEQQASCCVPSCTSVVGEKGENCTPGATLVNNANNKYPGEYGVNGGCCEYLDTSQMDNKQLYNILNSADYKCGSPGEACVMCGNINDKEECPVKEDWTTGRGKTPFFYKYNLLKYYLEDDSSYGTLCGVNAVKRNYNCGGGGYGCGVTSTDKRSSGTRGKKCAIPQ